MFRSQPIGALRGIGKSFGGLQVLQHVDLDLDVGQILGIVGSNGSGKTTLVNLIGGQLAPDRGEVLLKGADVTAESDWTRANRGIGRIFQESRLWPTLTAAEHLALVAPSEDPGNFFALIGIGENLLHRRPTQLRLLDRRRIELALAFARKPALLLVDEIGAGLRIDEAHGLYDAIGKAVAGHTAAAVIAIEHRLELLVSCASEIGLLEGGRIATRTRTDVAETLETLKDSLFLGWRAVQASPTRTGPAVD
jgi:branched-chain amino acid transport system ATP-binding protein